jgi:hypothetical protein
MTNMKFDTSHAANVTLDARLASEMAFAVAGVGGQSPPGQLACKWESSAGRLICTWRRVSPQEAFASRSRCLTEPLPPEIAAANETRAAFFHA